MIHIKNKRADFIYNFDNKLEAGMSLYGEEVKSIRKSSPSLRDTYGFVKGGEVFLRLNLSNVRDSDRDIRLLLHKKEIYKINGLFSKKSYVIIPLELYEKNGRFKVLLGIGTAVKEIDKRHKIKEREMNKCIKESINNF